MHSKLVVLPYYIIPCQGDTRKCVVTCFCAFYTVNNKKTHDCLTILEVEQILSLVPAPLPEYGQRSGLCRFYNTKKAECMTIYHSENARGETLPVCYGDHSTGSKFLFNSFLNHGICLLINTSCSLIYADDTCL